MGEGHRERRALALVVGQQRGQVEVGQRVPADDEQGFVVAEAVGGVSDAARRAEGRLFDDIFDVHSEVVAVPVIVLDLGGQVLDGHDHVGDIVLFEQVQDVPQDRAVDDGEHGLGPHQCEGTEP